jgi:sortase (surface protein transpeptidase)
VRSNDRPAGSTRARARRWAAVGALLVGAAAVLITLATRDTAPADPPAPANDVASSASAPPPSPPSAAAPSPSPEHLRIASIGVSTDLVRLGLNQDRTVEVPRDAAQAGWFDQGPVPGQPGSSVVLGHVDSVEGPAVFHRLSQLRPGDPIEVQLSDGSVARFEVGRVATYANEDFPARDVYAGSPGRPALNLVTCGGEYDDERGGWQSNVVVFGVYVRTTSTA